MNRSHKAGRADDAIHHRIQEESMLLILGHTPDIPLVDLVHHLAECAECRRSLEEATEVAGLLPEALAEVHPPAHVRANILEHATRDATASTNGKSFTTEATAEPEDTTTAVSAPSTTVKRQRGWLIAAWVAFIALVTVGNVAWWQHSRSQQVALAALESRYESDLQWLRSAEQLLVRAEPPLFKGKLHPPTDPSNDLIASVELVPAGNAAIYTTSYSRAYLIVQVDGLRPSSRYTVWVHENGEAVPLGEFDSSPTGTGKYVHAVEAAQWHPLSLESIMLTVTEEPSGQTILQGQLI